jgi:hypothetical protein
MQERVVIKKWGGFAKVTGKRYQVDRWLYGATVKVGFDRNPESYFLNGCDEFDWGQCNHGSHELAKTILFDAAGPNIANTYADDFNDDFISRMPERGFVLPYKAITEWLELDKGVRV